MSVFRSYFKKNNTLIDNNLSNNSQNPVTEISYGTLNEQPSRFIFDVDFDLIKQRISEGSINPNRIIKHVLHMTNTISNAPEYIGRTSYRSDIQRAASFDLELFNIPEEWDEGSGYDLIYNDFEFPQPKEQASNWEYRKTNVPWTVEGGSYFSGISTILGSQRFEVGDEDLKIDITDYINQRLGITGATGQTGSTGYTGTSYGLGVKFPDDLEQLETTYRQAVGFYARKTHTFYEPYVETIIDDEIKDDRNYFYLDKDNDLYLYSKKGGNYTDVTINFVEIYDYEDNLIAVGSGDSIQKVSRGIYKITINISSDDYPDAVIFRDVWDITMNSKNHKVDNDFYLISSDKYYDFDLSNQIDFDNYFFYFWGIKQEEKIKRGVIRDIKLTLRELYSNQNNNLPLDIQYRLFTKVDSDHEIDVIPYTSVNVTPNGYYFNLDTGWLIPQDYWLQVRMKNGNYYENKEYIKFTVISDGIKEN